MKPLNLKRIAWKPLLVGCVALLVLGGHAADWSVVASFNAAKAGELAKAGGAEDYIYSLAEIPAAALAADSGERKIAFGDEIHLAWTWVAPGAQYKLKAAFLSDSSERVQQLEVNGQLLEKNLALPKWRVLEREWPVPTGALVNGAIHIAIKRMAGPNAVLSRLEVLSDRPQKLSLPPSLAEILAKMELPMPRLSPRPVKVPGVKKPLQSLNGIWKFNPAPPEGFEKFNVAQTKKWKNIAVPGEWVMQGFEVRTNLAAGYWREFEIPDDWCGQRVKLRFGTVHSDCRVFVNGREVGAHEGCFTAFELDITDAVKPGRNTLALAVKNESTADTLASATQYAAHQLGGITRKVQIFALPPVNLASQVVETKFDGQFENATLKLKWSIVNEASKQTSSATWQHPRSSPSPPQSGGEGWGEEARFSSSNPLPTSGKTSRSSGTGVPPVIGAGVSPASQSTNPFARTGGTHCPTALAIRTTLFDGKKTAATNTKAICIGDSEISISITAPKKWDSEHPNLYSLKTELLASGKMVEEISQRFGFRQIEVLGNQLIVNGVPVKLRGACRHEVDPVRGRSLTPDDWKKDAELFREANVNYIRTSHYPPAEEFLDLCDEYGFFVECEAPLCWVQHGANSVWGAWNYQDQRFFPYLLRANLENVAANRNHPCVTIWSLANESRWSPLFAEVNRRVKLADATRPTSFHDQCWGGYNNARSQADIAVYHYPDESGPAKCDTENRPVLFGEYCHVECYNRRELATDPGVRDDWGRGFARMSDLMYQHDGCLGGAIWAGIDDVFCLPNGKFVGYGMWGSICDGWRRDKPETWHVKKTYSPIRVTARELPLPVTGQPIRVPIENRYNFANLNEVGIAWDVAGNKGKSHANLPARHNGELEISTSAQIREGDALHLVFTDPRGFVCDEEKIVLGKPAAVRNISVGESVGKLSIAQTPQSIQISGRNVKYAIDRKTGQFISGSVRGKTVLTGGPALMILPLQTEACEPVNLGVWKPLNNVCENWRAELVTAKELTDGEVEVTVSGSCREAAGGYVIRLDASGQIQVSYDFSSRIQENPRQWGMVFFTPPNFNTLNWIRQAQWTAYPKDHIGRPTGTAIARVAIGGKPYPIQKPDHVWSLDATELGGNDFSSTKTRIFEASLAASRGRISIASDGHQSVRAFVADGCTGLLVTGFHTGGGDGFFNAHLAAERKPINPGSKLSDTIRLRLSDN